MRNPFSKISNTKLNFDTPQEMYDDYKTKKIQNLYDYQSQIINNYLEEYNSKDVAFELPTGTGKTLVGLLIGEFRRVKEQEKILYLCPNKQLVNQTASQANNLYGIEAIPFTGSQHNYLAKEKTKYTTGNAIAISTYSSLFNINPFFNDPDLIIFDDAHSAENYISNYWTVKIDKKTDNFLYFKLLDIFKPYITNNLYNLCLCKEDDSNYDVDKIPNINFLDIEKEVIREINDYLIDKDSSIQYSWSAIKNNLKSCNIFISPTQFVIRPYISPTQTFEPFTNAKQRIYMSATLGKSGELERAFGMSNIKKLPMVKNWEQMTIGRRFFLFPSANFTEDDSDKFFYKSIDMVDRSLLIVPNSSSQLTLKNKLENYGKKIFLHTDIEMSKSDFINSTNSIAILANRFDGIDFPNDECRLETIKGFQRATNIQERFIIYRMGASVLFSERIRTRLIQTIGRCTRNSSDYAAISLYGNEAMQALMSPQSLKYLNPELQAELEFGLANAMESENINNYLDRLNVFLSPDRTIWREYGESEIINKREEIINSKQDLDFTAYEELHKSAPYEINTQYCLWKEDYSRAYNNVAEIFEILTHESLKGYLAYWYYIGSYCLYNLYINGDDNYKNKHIDLIKKASNITKSLPWLNRLSKISHVPSNTKDYNLPNNIDRLEEMVSNYSSFPNKYIFNILDEIIIDLNSCYGDKFEKSFYNLALWLGYRTENPEGTGAPDPLWIINDNYVVATECKIYNKEDKNIPLKHIRQSITHSDWVINNVNSLNTDKSKITVIITFVSNYNSIEEDIKSLSENINFLHRDDLVNWAKKAINILKELIPLFNETGDLIWRDKAMQLFTDKKITPNSFIELVTKNSINDL